MKSMTKRHVFDDSNKILKSLEKLNKWTGKEFRILKALLPHRKGLTTYRCMPEFVGDWEVVYGAYSFST
jgi:hypothetical protein